MGMRTWLTNLSENGQIRLLNVQLDRLYKALGLTGDSSSDKGGGSGPIITYPITIDRGGTGAVDVSAARENLEAAHKDHVHSVFENEVQFNGSINAAGGLILPNGKKFGWHPGDSITFPGVICFPGYITSSNASVRFNVNVGGPIFASGVSFSGGVLIRTIKGYINSSSAVINVGASGYSWSNYGLDKAGGNICVMLTKSSAFTNTTNNTPIIAQSSNFTIKFT